MTILETLENNNRLNFYIFLVILVFLLFVPLNFKSNKKNDESMKNISIHVKQFTNHMLLK